MRVKVTHTKELPFFGSGAAIRYRSTWYGIPFGKPVNLPAGAVRFLRSRTVRQWSRALDGALRSRSFRLYYVKAVP